MATPEVSGQSAVCPHCAHRVRIRRPALLIVTGAAGSGKSATCGRLAGKLPGVVVLDGDAFAAEARSVASPVKDYAGAAAAWVRTALLVPARR